MISEILCMYLAIILGVVFPHALAPRLSGRIVRRHPRCRVGVTGLFNGHFDPPNLSAPVSGSGRCMHPRSRRDGLRSARRRSGVLVDERKHRVCRFPLYSSFDNYCSFFCSSFGGFDCDRVLGRSMRDDQAQRWPRGWGCPGTRRVGMHAPQKGGLLAGSYTRLHPAVAYSGSPWHSVTPTT